MEAISNLQFTGHRLLDGNIPAFHQGDRNAPAQNHAQGEQRTIELAQRGDLAAFNSLVLAYQDAVYRQACW